MNKKGATIFLALFLNILFSSIFLASLFFVNGKSDQSVSVCMNQIGIFSSEENANELISQVQAVDIPAYTYHNQDLSIVVTSIFEDEASCIEQQTQLSQNNISFILKKVSSSNPAFIEAVKNQDYTQIMELMENQSK